MTFKTADLCDAHGSEIEVCTLQLRSFGGRRSFCGPVATLRTRADAGLVRQCLMQPGHGRVLVVDGQGVTEAAVLGDMLAAHAVRNGWNGVVVFGAVRDTQALSRMDLGVLALATSPQRGCLDGQGEIGVEINLGGVRFAPESHLYCDSDGLIVSNRAFPLQDEGAA